MTKHDDHYKALEPHEPWDVIQTWIKANNSLFSECPERAFEYGNILKYLARIGLKESPVKDLEKAQNYLSRLIEGIKETEKKNVDWESFILSESEDDEFLSKLSNYDNDNPDYTNITADCNTLNDRQSFKGAFVGKNELYTIQIKTENEIKIKYHHESDYYSFYVPLANEDSLRVSVDSINHIFDRLEENLIIPKGVVFILSGYIDRSSKSLEIKIKDSFHKFDIF